MRGIVAKGRFEERSQLSRAPDYEGPVQTKRPTDMTSLYRRTTLYNCVLPFQGTGDTTDRARVKLDWALLCPR